MLYQNVKIMIKTFSQACDSSLYPGEINSPESDVVPSMSLTVRDILTRFRRGTLSPDDIAAGVYNDEDFGGDETFMEEFEACETPMDKLDLARKYKSQITDLYEQIKQSSGYRPESRGDSGHRNDSDSQPVSGEETRTE
ncbi:hypothetical protein [Dipodfec virus UA23Rod_1340]|uniref:Uncharacterized protein n=1 Tax=Dipodfec virus UA23Rod_1340 TaxID=2929330 RepID=A0A976R763_9VIRU|nr:hypothetical protein [Dipodfec virus UA23Rod_1340]